MNESNIKSLVIQQAEVETWLYERADVMNALLICRMVLQDIRARMDAGESVREMRGGIEAALEYTDGYEEVG